MKVTLLQQWHHMQCFDVSRFSYLVSHIQMYQLACLRNTMSSDVFIIALDASTCYVVAACDNSLRLAGFLKQLNIAKFCECKAKKKVLIYRE